MTTSAGVMDALAEVYDPELDEPITRLGFVSWCEVSPAGDVDVALRLPTPQCAPNFAFLMAADARTAVRRLPLVRRVTIRLEDHYTGDEINAAIGRGEGFTGAFPGETADDELGALRELFQRKALTARQAAVCEAMLAGGREVGALVGLAVADLPDNAAVRRCLELREQLGIASGADAPAFVLPSGEPLEPGQMQRWLRMARLVRTSLEANGGICRSLLQVRHGLATPSEED
jgi:metal-sulfur cluster biosynthetic enzyme